MQKKYGLFFEQILLSFISNFFAANGKEENNMLNLYRKLKTFFKVYRFPNFSKVNLIFHFRYFRKKHLKIIKM